MKEPVWKVKQLAIRKPEKDIRKKENKKEESKPANNLKEHLNLKLKASTSIECNKLKKIHSQTPPQETSEHQGKNV